MSKYLGDLWDDGSFDKVKGNEVIPILSCGECSCGYHFGVDATYLGQVNDFKFNCPSCGEEIDTAEIFPINASRME